MWSLISDIDEKAKTYGINLVRYGERDTGLLEAMKKFKLATTRFSQDVETPDEVVDMFTEECEGEVTPAELFEKGKALFKFRASKGLENVYYPMLRKVPVSEKCK